MADHSRLPRLPDPAGAKTSDGGTPIGFPGPLAPYASRAELTRGRLHIEPESATRTPFQRDRDRVIHAVAFRRLKHKTQVFFYHEGDYYRTRLTHSLEAAQISRSIARTLRLDEDLAECVALAHDLGHPPFGHTGEDALKEAMAPYGGFDHNGHSLRLLTRLENRHAAFRGLNLTWETLEGVVKHSEKLIGADQTDYPEAIAEYVSNHDLALDRFGSLESQVAAIADDIAYNNHDVDDGLRAGILSLDEAREQPLVGGALRAVEARWPDAPRDVMIAEAVSELIGRLVADVVAETRVRLQELRPECPDDIREAGRQTVAFSTEIETKLRSLRNYLQVNMYRHYKVNRARFQARRIVRGLFDIFFEDPGTLPPHWGRELKIACADKSGHAGEAARARLVCDYLAGMTDRYAIREHERLFSASPLL
ncbi:MAG: deoxyguanosinetriphosphate triphosphohydrolase [Alphaproteobacteria bacterium]|nr:deoxyguanosinetriphosphate triphosphohydrolase [Alphaproteobacteria bacterium]